MRALLLLAIVVAAAQAECIWIEGESPRELGAATVAAPRKEFLSGGQWLELHLDASAAEKRLGKTGALFAYHATTAAGRHELWARVGYEFARSPFDWCIDGASRRAIAPQELTSDLMELGFWCEVAWIKLGDVELGAGDHTIELRVPVTYEPQKDGSLKPRPILFACDCLCLTDAPFHPNGRFRPDEEWRQEIDRQAETQVFTLPAPASAERVELPLCGTWQIARYDEQELVDRAEPVATLPKPDDCRWLGIPVPAAKSQARPELSFCHRFVYRTRVQVPQEAAGRGFLLHFPSVNMLATVFVNGQRCGSTKAPFAIWDCDIGAAVKPGALNEVCVAIKDTYYGLADDTRHCFNTPIGLLTEQQAITRHYDFPVCFASQAGILEPPSLICCGAAYTADVFAIPSVRDHELKLQLALGGADAKGLTVENEVIPCDAGGAPQRDAKPELTFAAANANGAELTLSAKWPNPRLWWPDDPQQYCVVTRLLRDGKAIDVKLTKFGFREWQWDGPQFKLNGVPWQLRSDTAHAATPEATLALWRRHGQNMWRFRWDRFLGMDQVQALDFMDRSGVIVRRSGLFDGEFASYQLVTEVEQGGKKQRVFNPALYQNWLTQLRAQIRGERNHPSVQIWSIENEIAYINSRNFGLMEIVEPKLAEAGRAVMELDPTRPVMTDGGRALIDQSLPVNGCHYEEMDPREYPDEGYTLARAAARPKDQWNVWPWPAGKPVYMGESCGGGNAPSWYAGVGGESAFIGRSAAQPAIGLWHRMVSEGYRWQGVAAFELVVHDTGWPGQYTAWSPVCLLCRQWNWTFAGGSTIERRFKLINGTRDPSPLQPSWTLLIDGKPVPSPKPPPTLVAPGEGAEIVCSFALPAVTQRTAGELVLSVKRGNDEVFHDSKPLALLPADGGPKPKLAAEQLLVLDPQGAVAARLKARGIAFTPAKSLAELPEKPVVIVVGADAVDEREASDPKWQALAAAGARVLVLDQAHPLRYQALPADLEPTDRVGRVAFAENLAHPAFAGLGQPDFFTWSADSVVYRDVYKKASRGARSLAHCDDELSCSALAECAVGEGLLMLCQLEAGTKLGEDPVAQRLFDNLLTYCATYELETKPTASALPAGSAEAKLLADSGIRYDQTADALAAMGDGKHRIVVASATPESLHALAAHADQVRTFAEQGGWLMLWGLTPEGLQDYDAIVGVDHLIRPFAMERVTFPPVRHPLLSGLTLRDVVMDSSQGLNGYSGDKMPSDDEFSYVVDYDDIAPFCAFPGPEYWKEDGAKPGFDHWPRNMVNGFVAADSWKYCFSILLAKGEPTAWTLELPRPEEIAGFSIVTNPIYHRVTRIALGFDGEEPLEIECQQTSDRQDYAVEPARKTAHLRIELKDWAKVGSQDVIGVDNLWIKAKRSPEFYARVKPLLNIGGLVAYPIGAGGIVLNQLRVPEQESLPINRQKRLTIVAALLRNLGAPSAADRVIVAGSRLRYRPIALEQRCNQYLDRAQGWFDERRDLARFPKGESDLAGVHWLVRDFRTSPLPSCVMLAGPGAKGDLPKSVDGIPIGGKADALFFLHAFKQTKDWKPPRKGDATPPIAFRYVVHYADGQRAEVPVRLNEGAAHWIQKQPRGLKDAALAWSAPFPDDASGEQAAVFDLQWTNPRPEAEIAAVDLAYDPSTNGDYGVPALLAVTAASGSE